MRTSLVVPLMCMALVLAPAASADPVTEFTDNPSIVDTT
jgi:hypothetical protein